MLNFNDIVGLTDGFFLLFLAVSGNFIAETLGCETQFLFSNNLIFKQIIVFLVLFFTINFTSKDEVNPIDGFIKAAILWLFFLFFTKMTVNFTLFVILLLMIIFIIEKQKAYLNRTKKNTSDSTNILTNNLTNTINQDREKNKIDTLTRYQEILFILSFFLVAIGFTRYYNAKKIEYKSAFKLKNFFFGVNKCKSIKKLK